jgi:hypothetical protein
VAQLDALAEEFVQAVLLDSEYLVVMVREGAKIREKRMGRAAARAAG